MKPEYIKDDYDDEKYVYALCKCPFPSKYSMEGFMNIRVLAKIVEQEWQLLPNLTGSEEEED